MIAPRTRTGLIRARIAAGLTQRELAERLGLATRVRISQYERGEKEPGVDLALRIAAALGTTVETAFNTAPGTKAGRGGAEETSPEPATETTDAER
jgi:transcriptional regulator with XRE-family HTH domain